MPLNYTRLGTEAVTYGGSILGWPPFFPIPVPMLALWPGVKAAPPPDCWGETESVLAA